MRLPLRTASLPSALLVATSLSLAACGAPFIVGDGGSGGASSSGGLGGTGGTASDVGATGTGGAQPCSVDADCPSSLNECLPAKCEKGSCTYQPAPEGMVLAHQVLGNCEQEVCDGKGAAKEGMVDPTDVPDDGNPCTADSCEDGKPANTNAAGAECPLAGGVTGHCNAAGQCIECSATAPCDGGHVCVAGECVNNGCANNQRNGNETDVDCGGPDCPKCAGGKMCTANTDCESAACAEGKCKLPTCDDGVRDGLESDVDCGVACPTKKCPAGLACKVNGDCVSGVCSGGFCAPTCTDGAKDGAESDTDCGQVCPTKCANGKKCSSGLDCQSGFCAGAGLNVCAF